MNLDAETIALSQIQYLVTSLNKKNYKSSITDCLNLVDKYGLESERHLLKILFAQSELATSGSARPTSPQLQFLTFYCESLFHRPNFVSLICFSVEHLLAQSSWARSASQLVSLITKNLRLSPLRCIAFALALKHSAHPQLVKLADQYLEENLPVFLHNLQSSQSKFLEPEKNLNITHFVLSELPQSEFKAFLIDHIKLQKPVPLVLVPFVISQDKRSGSKLPHTEEDTSEETRLRAEAAYLISSLFPFQTDTFAELLSNSLGSSAMALPKSRLDTALPEIIRELGYQFTANPETCRHGVHKLIDGVGTEMHAPTIARIIGIMVRTHTGLDDSGSLQQLNATGTSLWEKKDSEQKTWNVEVFIKVVTELQPALHWKEIMGELDHPGFAVKDRQGLLLLLKALKVGFQCQGFPGPFPINMFFGHWKNTDGQVSLFQQALRNPDVFNFGDYARHLVAVDVLKVMPDKDNRELSAWHSLEVIDTLLYLAEAGHTHAVKEIFSIPLAQCPDVLTLGLMQINPPLSVFRSELLVQCLQVFLGNHPNSMVILHYAWQASMMNLRMLVIHAMGEWYSKAGQECDTEHTRLSRILEVAQDLKALSILLTVNPSYFVIDLAVLASRREYLNLEKWLNDQSRDHRDLVKTVVSYLQRKLPNIHGPGPLKEEHLMKVNFHAESLTTILFFLQNIANTAQMPPDLKDHIINMCSNSQSLLSKIASSRPQQPITPQPLTSMVMGPGNTRSVGNLSEMALRASTRSIPPAGGASIDHLTNIASQLNIGGSNSSFNLSGAPGMVSAGGSSALVPPSSPSRMFPGTIAQNAPSMESVGGSSSPFNPVIPNPSPAPVSQTSTSSAAVSADSIRQQGISNISNLFPDAAGQISREIEDESNAYFQRIYNHPPHPTLTIDEVLALLKKFQDSPIQRERHVFTCMIKNLFEEYKYFPQYPEKELHITAQLFGGIIENALVNMVPLGLALRFVLDAVRKAPDNKMFYFGITALDRFKTRLKDYPQYCNHVSGVPHFKDFPPHLIEWVELGAQSIVPPTKPTGPVLPPQLEAIVKGTPPPAPPPPALMGAVTSAPPPSVPKPNPTSTGPTNASAIVRPTAIGGRPSIANTTNIDTLLTARVKAGLVELIAPSDAVQDRVAFIFNNLSLINVRQKSDDLIETLRQEAGGEETKFYNWLANYLVLKRVTIEPNFHSVYANFLEVLHNELLYGEVLKDTYVNIRFLLTNDKSIANFSDRSLLKNLGHWLGLITLARNMPILLVDLDLKPLIIEAHQIGQQELMYVVPFVAKVLDSCSKSKVFKPPSPWTMGIMNLLAELHQENELKLNLKFEIEVLCKNLSIELTSLRPGNLLNKQLQIRSFGLKSQTPPASTGQIGGSLHPKNLVQDSFGMVHAPNLGQRKHEQSISSHHPPAVDPIHLSSSSLAMNSSSVHAFSGSSVNNVVANAPGSGLGGALVHGPLQQPQQPQQQVTGDTTPSTLVAAASQMRPPDPKFHFTDISTANLNGIVPHIVVNSGLPLTKDQPEVQQLIKVAIEKSIQDVASPVVDRAVRIAVTTCEQIVKKDFALDHDENRMRQDAHNMVRNLTAGMAMITCRDHLHSSIKTHLKNLMTCGRSLTSQQLETIDMTVNVVANDNVELGCAFIQKRAIDRAVAEIDKRLKSEYEVRIIARKEGRPYFDAVAASYQAERIPEKVRLKVGGPSPQQNSVYDEFARNIPGFKILTDREISAIAPKLPLTPTVEPTGQITVSEECISIVDDIQSKLEPFVQSCTTLPANPHMSNLHALIDALTLARNSKDVSSVMILISKAVISLLEGLTPHIQVDTESLARYRDANLLVLRALADNRAFGHAWVSSRVTASFVDASDDIKYNLDAVDALIRSGVVSLHELDKHLVQAMANGENVMATAFAMHLCKIYLIDDRSHAHIFESDLFGIIEVLQRISTQSPHPPDGIVHLMDMIKMSSERLEQNLAMSGPTAQLHSGIAQAREFEDPPGLIEKTEYLLREWVNAYHSRDAGKDSRQAFVVFVQLMNQHGILKTDDLITRFFRMSTQMCVDLCYRALSDTSNSPTLVRAKCFHTLDAYVRLITLLVKHSGETQNTITKVNLLNKVLGTVAGVLLIDHGVRAQSFQQVPYHRIFIMLFLELCSPDPILENISFQVLTAYCNMLHILRPEKATGFAFAWLEIVSHRVFMGRILSHTPGQKGWPIYAQLLVDLFKFLSPFLRNAELDKPVQLLYKGSLRVLLVLLHDFPEFLCDYHYGFCDVIPPNCIQLRNLILSAFPRNMRLPDPFTPNLIIDNLPEVSIAPRPVTNYAGIIRPEFKKDLDSYLKNRSPVAFLSELRSNLLMPSTGSAEAPTENRYNIQLINALVMYVGTSAIQFIRAKGLSPKMSTIAHSSHMDIFQNLAVDLETEGRYLFLNCIANQLRYPNSHTHYFSCTLLYLFAEANQEAIQEQITRVLLERLIVNRPHPWGLLITFIELIKNTSYNFWDHEFVHCAPEIQKLFESVARSCMVTFVPRHEPDGTING